MVYLATNRNSDILDVDKSKVFWKTKNDETLGLKSSIWGTGVVTSKRTSYSETSQLSNFGSKYDHRIRFAIFSLGIIYVKYLDGILWLNLDNTW